MKSSFKLLSDPTTEHHGSMKECLIVKENHEFVMETRTNIV